ncbi:hypothetical protein GS597_05680 [Synechococcales cyanobacterium C]|uniref:2TM domain-containing protein n=1 Tax=Petrachloros mirabilis ULC683 TaxID=2781853 RepID=A0A8K2A7E9_9CYAN|nr:2TM domain-containing protein [Petrachloros mirabilis]NCJ06010.1 hypothetical protein [Petrachloros mirabilis ULC683]
MSNFQSQPIRYYTQEEVQQILNVAIARQVYQGEFTRSQLLEIAADLGITPAELDVAEQTWQQQQGELQKRQAFNQYRQANLRRDLGRYGIVNGILVLINLLTGFSTPWSLYVLLGWGLKLSLNAWNVYHPDGEAYELAFQRWYRKHQFRNFINTWIGRLLNA